MKTGLSSWNKKIQDMKIDIMDLIESFCAKTMQMSDECCVNAEWINKIDIQVQKNTQKIQKNKIKN